MGGKKGVGPQRKSLREGRIVQEIRDRKNVGKKRKNHCRGFAKARGRKCSLG
jgi:hypothetical protein